MSLFRGVVKFKNLEVVPGGKIGVVVVNLTAANIMAMYATPVLVLPAVSGRMIAVDSVDFIMTRTATAFTGGGSAKVQYGDTEHAGGTGVIASITSSTITGAEGKTYTTKLPVEQANKSSDSVVGVGLYISNLTAAFATGTGTAVVTIWYHLI